MYIYYRKKSKKSKRNKNGKSLKVLYLRRNSKVNSLLNSSFLLLRIDVCTSQT